MRKKILAGMVLTFALSSVASVQAEDKMMNMNNMSSASPTMSASPMAKMDNMSKMSSTKTMMTDSEILGMVKTVDMDEIEASKKAQTKKLSAKVSDYAKMMVTHHTKNLTKDNALAKTMKVSAAMNAEATKMHKEDAAKLAQILKTNGMAFDKAYMDMMIAGHKKALSNLDSKLIPAAKNAELKKHLTATRATVKSHLDMATSIRKNLT